MHVRAKWAVRIGRDIAHAWIDGQTACQQKSLKFRLYNEVGSNKICKKCANLVSFSASGFRPKEGDTRPRKNLMTWD